jgi:uncharacterized phage protein (TIGR01671 family)
MREPKFRGFCTETNSWHYGYGWFKSDYTEEYKQRKGIEDTAILYTNSYPVECELKSMGESTSLFDCKGVEIFEGDILQPSNGEKKFYVVVWKNGGFQRKYRFIRKYQGEQWEESSYAPVHPNAFKVIGNIFEQKEPLN